MMTIYYKTKDGAMIWVNDVTYVELENVADGTIRDGKWVFENGRK